MTTVRSPSPSTQPTTLPGLPHNPQRVADAPALLPNAPLPEGTLPALNAELPRSRSELGGFFGSSGGMAAARGVLLGAVSVLSLFAGAGQAQAATAAPTAAVQVDRSIVYVGMNETAAHEVQALKNAGASVTFIKSAKEADTIKVGATTYDLKTEEGRLAFTRAIGLKDDRATAVATALGEIGEGARDEAAQFAKILRDAEKGTRNIERVVLSGHSVGSVIWGDGNGMLNISAFGNLISLFPRGAGQVQDLGIAACYSGGESTMDNYRAIFPNLKTIWAYDGSAPGSYSGAVPHILRWERQTRGNAESINRKVADGTRKGENVAVWSATKGYDNGKPLEELESAMNRYTSTAETAKPFYSGEETVTDSQTGPLREHYNNIQRLLSRRDLTTENRTSLQQERDTTIRLLFWKNVGQIFQATHGSSLRTASQELGIAAPDFSKLSRKEALDFVKTFDTAKAEKGMSSRNVTYAERLLHQGIVELNPTVIPSSWL